MVKNAKEAIVKCVDNGERIIKTLEANYASEQIGYFALSSIGFYNQPGGSINLDDCNNIVDVPSSNGSRIRSGNNMTPVMVWRPIAWLVGTEK